jgi:hypothetical protein
VFYVTQVFSDSIYFYGASNSIEVYTSRNVDAIFKFRKGNVKLGSTSMKHAAILEEYLSFLRTNCNKCKHNMKNISLRIFISESTTCWLNFVIETIP